MKFSLYYIALGYVMLCCVILYYVILYFILFYHIIYISNFQLIIFYMYMHHMCTLIISTCRKYIHINPSWFRNAVWKEETNPSWGPKIYISGDCLFVFGRCSRESVDNVTSWMMSGLMVDLWALHGMGSHHFLQPRADVETLEFIVKIFKSKTFEGWTMKTASHKMMMMYLPVSSPDLKILGDPHPPKLTIL